VPCLRTLKYACLACKRDTHTETSVLFSLTWNVVVQLKKELEEMRTRADANAEFHSTLTEQVVELTEQLQREIRNSEESKAKCADLTKIALEKDNKLMRKKAKLNQYKNEEAESNEGLERMRAEIADLMSALESKTTEIADLQTTMQEAQLRYSDDVRSPSNTAATQPQQRRH